jgi:hypothetical protein
MILWETVMAISRYYPAISLAGQKEVTKKPVRVAGIPTEIRTQLLPNTSQERYRRGNPLEACHTTTAF